MSQELYSGQRKGYGGEGLLSTTVYFNEQVITSSGGIATVNWRLGNKAIFPLTENVTAITFIDPGGASGLQIILVQDNPDRTVTGWDADVEWNESQGQPQMPPGSGKRLTCSFDYSPTLGKYVGSWVTD